METEILTAISGTLEIVNNGVYQCVVGLHRLTVVMLVLVVLAVVELMVRLVRG